MADVALNDEKFNQLGVIGSRAGIAGAILLSTNSDYSPYGYILFLVSSICLVMWGRANNFKHQFEMQVVFTLVNLNGLVNWLLIPLFNQ